MKNFFSGGITIVGYISKSVATFDSENITALHGTVMLPCTKVTIVTVCEVLRNCTAGNKAPSGRV